MRISELVQTGTETITETVLVEDFNEDGELVGTHEEAVTREIPIMSMVYRDMTPEEEAEVLAQQAQAEEYERTRPRTVEEKLDALMEYMGVKGVWNGNVFEVVKADMPTGDYTNPIQWVDGMAVTAGLFYWFDDYDYRLEALADGVPASWGAEPFEQL